MNQKQKVKIMKAELWIPLSNGMFTVIDLVDYEKISGRKWHALHGWRNKTWYAQCNLYDADTKAESSCALHRFLMNAASGEMVDHKDGDGLNNRRDNLRIATRSQNSQNSTKRKNCSSQFKGVCWYPPTRKWVGQLRVAGKRIYLGYFQNEQAAARAYDAAAIKYFGEFALLNFPDQNQKCQSLISNGGAA